MDRPLGGWDGHHRVEMAIGWLLGWVDWPLDGRGGYWVGWELGE